MIQPSTDYMQIVSLFDKYMKDKTTRVLTHAGFWKFLIVQHAMPAWLVRNLKRQVKLDPNLAFHIDTVIEDFLLTGSLTGTLKDSAVKLLLKNKFGYEEAPTVISEETQKVKTITYRPAVQADVDKLAMEAPSD